MICKIFGVSMVEFVNILERHDFIDRLYSALRSHDLADVVMIALDVVNKMNINIEKTIKTEQQSRVFRLKGNEAFRNMMYRDALIYYNLALLFAPTNSESTILGLSNRSALLLQVGAKDACLKDIQRCRTMKCSAEMIRKLEARKSKCAGINSIDVTNTREYKFARDFFKFDLKRNKDISCASEDVDVIRENGVTKFIAAKNIEIGKVVAIEPAFAAILHEETSFTSCYHCHKMSFNLIPCDGCCKALFCDEECKKQCFNEYHKIECQIKEVVDFAVGNPKCNLSTVATLKMREMSASWDELISHSLKIGKSRLDESSVTVLYDQSNIKSMLFFNDDKHFIHGKTFNYCFYYAHVIKYLSNITDYLPEDGMKKTEAQRALARIMLNLYLNFPCGLDYQNYTRIMPSERIRAVRKTNCGLFSFAGKLTHSCSSNLYCAALGNKLALIAVKSIKKGTELTISLRGHWTETIHGDMRLISNFMMAELTCQCRICIENWKLRDTNQPIQLNDEQGRSYRNFLLTSSSRILFSGEQFRENCRALKVFQDVGNTPEFKAIFTEFRNRLVLFQYVATKNVCL